MGHAGPAAALRRAARGGLRRGQRGQGADGAAPAGEESPHWQEPGWQDPAAPGLPDGRLRPDTDAAGGDGAVRLAVGVGDALAAGDGDHLREDVAVAALRRRPDDARLAACLHPPRPGLHTPLPEACPRVRAAGRELPEVGSTHPGARPRGPLLRGARLCGGADQRRHGRAGVRERRLAPAALPRELRAAQPGGQGAGAAEQGRLPLCLLRARHHVEVRPGRVHLSRVAQAA
mmetsp:Transcript_41397/g.128989  ORF Transcript_41397/g.128989 Transcript_41397/m.128989 type:complete len:232 (-) Transcript_41397:1386-2081(-)